jgi:hypothetical protein
MDSCDDCGITEAEGGDIEVHQVTPPGEPDNAYDAALCEGCVLTLSENGCDIA